LFYHVDILLVFQLRSSYFNPPEEAPLLISENMGDHIDKEQSCSVGESVRQDAKGVVGRQDRILPQYHESSTWSDY
jgi:hypothetical protein